MKDKMKELYKWIDQQYGSIDGRVFTDSAPVLDRAWASKSGLGWIGKNSNLINRELGSFVFIGELIIDLELEYNTAPESDFCGSCSICIDSCPTEAILDGRTIDANKCISFLTIENRNEIPEEFTGKLENRMFGCDICQQVCPWNRHAPLSEEPTFQPRDESNPTSLVELFDLNDEQFRQRYRHTPLWRTRRRGILRNAAIVLGNQKYAAAVPALTRGLGDEEPMIRGASAWALGQIGGNAAKKSLQTRREQEEEPKVASEIHAALKFLAT